MKADVTITLWYTCKQGFAKTPQLWLRPIIPIFSGEKGLIAVQPLS
jgi:hypothetical protein